MVLLLEKIMMMMMMVIIVVVVVIINCFDFSTKCSQMLNFLLPRFFFFSFSKLSFWFLSLLWLLYFRKLYTIWLLTKLLRSIVWQSVRQSGWLAAGMLLYLTAVKVLCENMCYFFQLFFCCYNYICNI